LRPNVTSRAMRHDTGAIRLYHGHLVWLEWQS